MRGKLLGRLSRWDWCTGRRAHRRKQRNRERKLWQREAAL